MAHIYFIKALKTGTPQAPLWPAPLLEYKEHTGG